MAGLTFNKLPIRSTQDLVCLNDLWQAAQGNKRTRPQKWLLSKKAKRFVACLGDILSIAEADLLRCVPGNTSSSTSWWAHWQVARVYSRSLSQDLYAWCDVVLRNHMTLPEQKCLTTAQVLLDQTLELQQKVLSTIKGKALKAYLDGSQRQALRKQARRVVKKGTIMPVWELVQKHFNYSWSLKAFGTVPSKDFTKVYDFLGAMQELKDHAMQLSPSNGVE